MAITNSTNLAERAIADMAWARIYDSFPIQFVSRASGPRGFKYARPDAASNGVPVVANENASISDSAWDPTFEEVSLDLSSFRAKVQISNELVADSRVWPFIAQRLAGQIIEEVGIKIVDDIATALIAASRTTGADHFDVGEVGLTGAPKIEDHSGFKCISEVNNEYRQRGCWIFSPSGFQNWGTQEGRSNMVTLGVRMEDHRYGRLIGEATGSGAQIISPLAGGGGGGGGGKGGVEEGELSKTLPLHLRSRLIGMTPTQDEWHTAYLGNPVYTSSGLDVTHNGNGNAWAVFVDLSAYLLFDQPLSVKLDTESRLAQNQSTVHAVYRVAGELMEPTAGWALVSPA